MEMRTVDTKYQLVTPSTHRAKHSERAIKTFKNHFIVVICSIDKDFYIKLCDRLIHKSKISLNMLIKSRIHTHLSAYTHIFGEFDYNCILLAPPGTRIVIHERPKDISSLAPHGESC